MKMQNVFFLLSVLFLLPQTVYAQAEKTLESPTNMSTLDNPISVRVRKLEKFQAIKVGTPAEEVLKAFGEPDGDPSSDPKFGKMLPIYIMDDGSKVMINYEEGKVKSVLLIKADKTFVDITAK